MASGSYGIDSLCDAPPQARGLSIPLWARKSSSPTKKAGPYQAGFLFFKTLKDRENSDQVFIESKKSPFVLVWRSLS